MSCSVVDGSLATGFLTDSHLCEGQGLTAAGGAEFLPVAGGAAECVVEAYLGQDGAEVVDVHAGGVSLAAADAVCTIIVDACLLVEFDAELGGALEDVKELSKGEEQQGSDHGDGVQDSEKAVSGAAQPFLRDGEHQAGDGDGEQQDDGEEVHAELLQGTRSLVGHATPEGQADSCEHQDG